MYEVGPQTSAMPLAVSAAVTGRENLTVTEVPSVTLFEFWGDVAVRSPATKFTEPRVVVLQGLAIVIVKETVYSLKAWEEPPENLLFAVTVGVFLMLTA